MAGERVPLSVREGGDGAIERWGALHPGVPDWMREPLWNWVDLMLKVNGTDLLGLGMALRIGLGGGGIEDLKKVCFSDAQVYLDAVDLLLSDVDDPRFALGVEHVLLSSGSEWAAVDRPGGARWTLAKRLHPVVQGDVERALIYDRPSGKILRNVYAETYGRNPKPNVSYSESIRAIECAAAPIVTPNDEKATLGKIERALREAPTGKFEFALPGDEHVSGPEAVRSLMKVVWTSHQSRHGEGDVTQAEAEAAFHAAVLLVHWCESGALRVAG